MSKDWPVYRRIISWGARVLAIPLTSISDPMTGVFAIRKETVRPAPPSFQVRPATTPHPRHPRSHPILRFPPPPPHPAHPPLPPLSSPQFLASHPLNPSGFKLALELLLKAPLPPGARAVSLPYSFGTRSVGASKLSSKTMLLYVGQLLSLYAWAWGLAFNALLGATAAVAVVLVEHGLGRVKQLHRERAGGLGLPGMAPPKDKLTERYKH